MELPCKILEGNIKVWAKILLLRQRIRGSYENHIRQLYSQKTENVWSVNTPFIENNLTLALHVWRNPKSVLQQKHSRIWTKHLKIQAGFSNLWI